MTSYSDIGGDGSMQDKKPTRREREKARQRGQILEVALTLFSEKGYHTVSMHEIAKMAEFAIGTVYSFFKNKEDLYKSLLIEKANEYHRYLKDILTQDSDMLTVIKNYITAKGDFVSSSVAILRLYFAETRGTSFNIKAGLDQDIRKLYDDLVMQLSSVMKKGIRQKTLRKINPYYMALAIEELTNAFLLLWLEDSEHHPYKANVPVIMELFLKGCAANEQA